MSSGKRRAETTTCSRVRRRDRNVAAAAMCWLQTDDEPNRRPPDDVRCGSDTATKTSTTMADCTGLAGVDTNAI